MAEVATQSATPIATPRFRGKPIIQHNITSAPLTQTRPSFDPDHHLSFKTAPKTLSLKDIGLSEDVGISPIAVSDPFPLFNEEAIRMMRSEIFSQEVWDNCMISSEFAGCQLRGHCPKYAPFMHAAWKHSKTLQIISDIAGVDLIPQFDYEIGSINISVLDPEAEDTTTLQSNEAIPVTKWHHDSYPFVCVVMMSDASTMQGGETALKTASGDILKVRGPQMGSAVVLQGRYISHQALSAVGGTERITMITSFRPRNPFIKDESNLKTIRGLSDLSEVYLQWTQYRIDVMQQRLDEMQKRLKDQRREGTPTDVHRIKEFLAQQEAWFATTNSEIVAVS